MVKSRPFPFISLSSSNEGFRGGSFVWSNGWNDMELFSKSATELDIVIEGMFEAGKVEAGWDLFCSLSHKGVKPDIVTYNTMISGLCNNRLKHEAYALLRKMKQDGSLSQMIVSIMR